MNRITGRSRSSIAQGRGITHLLATRHHELPIMHAAEGPSDLHLCNGDAGKPGGRHRRWL